MRRFFGTFAVVIFGWPFYGMLPDSFYSFFFGNMTDAFFHIWNQMIPDFWTWQIGKNNILFDLKCWLNCPHCRENPGTHIFMCLCVCVRARVQGHSLFCQRFGQVEPFSTQIKRGCQKAAKNIKWNNTWKFNSTETFDRNKQRNCTWIEQRAALPLSVGFSMRKPL